MADIPFAIEIVSADFKLSFRLHFGPWFKPCVAKYVFNIFQLFYVLFIHAIFFGGGGGGRGGSCWLMPIHLKQQ